MKGKKCFAFRLFVMVCTVLWPACNLNFDLCWHWTEFQWNLILSANPGLGLHRWYKKKMCAIFYYLFAACGRPVRIMSFSCSCRTISDGLVVFAFLQTVEDWHLAAVCETAAFNLNLSVDMFKNWNCYQCFCCCILTHLLLFVFGVLTM